MRGWMRPLNRIAPRSATATRTGAVLTATLLLAAGLATATAGPAFAENGTPPKGTTLAPATSPAVVNSSAITGVAFPRQPFPLQDDGTYRSFLDKLAAERGGNCGAMEAYGWSFKAGDQAALDGIFSGTMAAYRKDRWVLTPIHGKSIENRDVTAFTGTRSKKSILMLWMPMNDATMLLLCETD